MPKTVVLAALSNLRAQVPSVLKRLSCFILLFGVLLSDASAQVKIGLLVSATGPMAAIGIPQKRTGTILPDRVGIIPLEYIQLDDGGDPARAVQNAKRLIQDEHVDALIGPSTTPNALAILAVVAESKIPLLAPVGDSSLVEPIDAARRWVFKTTQNDDLIASALIRHMVKHGIRHVGFIGLNDTYGENWDKVFTPMAAKAGIRVVANERYAHTDLSVTAQVSNLVAAKPDAIVIAAVGGSALLPQAALYGSHYRGQIYQTQAAATDDFIRRGGQEVEGTVLAAGLMRVIDDVADGDPIKEMAAAFIDRYRQAFNERPAASGANTFDAFILLARALPKAWETAAPGTEAFRVALRDALEAEKNIVGCQGVFNMSPTDHNGMDKRARVLVTIKNGRFRLLRE